MAIKIGAAKNLNKDNLVKNLVLNHKLVTHLDKAIAQFDEPWTYTYKPKEEDDAWHPSGDCTPSLHDLYHKAVNPLARKLTVSASKNFQVGHFFHQFLQNIVVEKLGFAGWDNVERRGATIWRYKTNMGNTPRPYHWATGSADIAPCDIPGHGKLLVDFKTMNSVMFKRPYPPEGFAQKWECQVNIYMDWFDLERAIIVGVQKDNPHDMKEFEYYRNQPLVDAIYEKWELVSECVDQGVEPPADEEHELPLAGHVA